MSNAWYTGPLHVLQDSGPPGDGGDHTTLVMVHGYAWHSGIFSKLVPLAASHNVRIILLNRRDYPGTLPYTDAERELLATLSPEAMKSNDKMLTARTNAAAFMQARARELFDLLTQLVKSGTVPALDREKKKGGIILSGWSFGTTWMTALLAHAASFPLEFAGLRDYMRRVVLLDPPYLAFGYPPPENQYNPLFDSEIPPGDRERHFANWVSGYYAHGDTPETLEPKTHLQNPPPTLSTLTPEEIGRTLCLVPGGPGGSDAMLLDLGIRLKLFHFLKEGAFYMPRGEQPGDTWDDVDVRYVWCERSVWEMPWGAWQLKKEMQAAAAEGLQMRDIQFAFVKGGNHFVHWDQPELALRALISEDDVVQ